MMPQVKNYIVTLPPPSAPDVVSRTFTVDTGNGETAQTLDTVVRSLPLSVNAGQLVKLSLVDTNDSQLSSPPSTLEFTAEAATAPPAPGTMTVAEVDAPVTPPATDSVVPPATDAVTPPATEPPAV